jgi:hypothetical protein
MPPVAHVAKLGANKKEGLLEFLGVSVEQPVA